MPIDLKKIFDIREELFFEKLDQIEYNKDLTRLEDHNRKIATLIMSFGRQTGATYWLAFMLDFCTKDNIKVAVVGLSQTQDARLKEYMRKYCNSDHSQISAISWHSILDSGMRGEDPEFVFFDATMSDSPRHKLYYEELVKTFRGKLIVIL